MGDAIKELQEKIAQLELEKKKVRQQLAEKDDQLAEQAAQLADKDARLAKTTFLELIQKSHEAFVDTLHVESDPTKATTGKTSKVTDKFHPVKLKRWLEFLELRTKTFDRMRSFFESEKEERQRFGFSPDQLEGNAAAAPSNISCEQDLRNYLSHYPEPSIKRIFARLIEIPGARQEFGLGDKMTFENHTHFDFGSNTLDILPEDVHLEAAEHQVKDTDQLCVKHLNSGKPSAVAIFEMKAPHKVTPELLTAGLYPVDDLRPSISKWVEEIGKTKQKKGTSKQKEDKLKNDEEKFQRAADKFVAMILTQTYHYMVRAGLGYGCIITGRAWVFLHIKEMEPDTLYFYHADPKAEVADDHDIGSEFPYECTAVAQLSCICLMAHALPQYPQDWCAKIHAEAPRWGWKWENPPPEVDVAIEAIDCPRPDAAKTPRHQITDLYRSVGPAPQPKPIVWSPGCKPEEKGTTSNSDESSTGSFNDQDSPTTQRRAAMRDRARHSNTEHQNDKQAPPKSSGTTTKYDFCSQSCLRGLLDGTALDPRCPNFIHHPISNSGYKHDFTAPQLTQLLRSQFAMSLNHYCVDLGLHGRTGMLFKVTLASHGYTFVAKGSVRGFVASSEKEEQVYALLKERQGKSIPVHLGSFDLVRPWIEPFFDIVHMLLLSWSGEDVHLNIACQKAGQSLIRKHKRRFERESMAMGIWHTDVENRNILWDARTNSITFIDFDQTFMFDPCHPPADVIDSWLYCDVFGSHDADAATIYLAKQERAKIANRLRDPTPGLQRSGSDEYSGTIIEPTLVPAWLFADDKAALKGLGYESAVSVDDSTSQVSIIASSSSPPKLRIPGPGQIKSKQAYQLSREVATREWQIYTDNGSDELPSIRFWPGNSNPVPYSKQASCNLDKADTSTHNSEDKENKRLADTASDLMFQSA